MPCTHRPVLLAEVVQFLDPRPGEIFVDATVGGGGHSAALLPRLLPGGYLIGLDRDAGAIEAAAERLAPFGKAVELVRANFKDLERVLESRGIEAVDGLLFDLGVSSYQLDNPARGFSYQVDAPLDMRMGQEQELTAAAIVNTWPEDELARIIWEYGEERWARRIAAFIVAARQKAPVTSTGQLVEIIKAAIPAGARRSGHHPAKRTFQALRIAINGELDALQAALDSLEQVLKPGGRVGVISFHSLEDRIVKRTFRRLMGHCTCPPGLPVCLCDRKAVLEPVTRKPVTPAPAEVAANPRSRSAKLRVARRVLKEKDGE
ncbi:16S rRNA (cytosine(1402)-N(4))-methyltransferase RsmH [Moorella sulfitireducens (nom. illeg.)]|uniref:16S rRNA (cytosine(1402)-N(4))-methyltransferase RsmH n=1 Tax=Neomoorella sulfitireducens TaxID=2972948 RepID=UPI0021ACDCEF|nr:16S rRNA (cytosine(1402)-N(4))-methyltransferase RsmH [Moorella sulfitireducens]